MIKPSLSKSLQVSFFWIGRGCNVITEKPNSRIWKRLFKANLIAGSPVVDIVRPSSNNVRWILHGCSILTRETTFKDVNSCGLSSE
jgi:hypothetical protein